MAELSTSLPCLIPLASPSSLQTSRAETILNKTVFWGKKVHGAGGFCWDLPVLVLVLVEKPRAPGFWAQDLKLGALWVAPPLIVASWCVDICFLRWPWSHFLAAHMANAWPAPWGSQSCLSAVCSRSRCLVPEMARALVQITAANTYLLKTICFI